MTDTSGRMTLVASRRPPKPDLDDGDIDACPGEIDEGDGRDEFEGRQPGDGRDVGLDLAHDPADLILRNLVPSTRTRSVKRMQVGRGVHPRLEPRRLEGRRRHRRDRALALRAGDVERWKTILRIPESGQQIPHSVQVEDLRRVAIAALQAVVDEAVKVVEGFGIGERGHSEGILTAPVLRDKEVEYVLRCQSSAMRRRW